MHPLPTDQDLFARIRHTTPHITITTLDGSRWGRLISPSPLPTQLPHHETLNMVFIGSWTLGLLALEALTGIISEQPGMISIQGLVTDDPLDTGAKISAKKRFWRYYTDSEKEKYEWGILHHALPQKIPCYTGDIKCEGFHRLLQEWDPDVILVAAFGQVIDEYIINHPSLGIYNIHPSDLLQGYGAGPQPWEDLIARKANTTRLTIHKVTEIIDSGSVVGRSPEINILLQDGSYCNDARMMGEKTFVPVEPMARELVLELTAKKKAGKTGFIEHIDFDSIFGPSYKARLMEPINLSERGHILPLPEGERSYTV